MEEACELCCVKSSEVYTMPSLSRQPRSHLTHSLLARCSGNLLIALRGTRYSRHSRRSLYAARISSALRLWARAFSRDAPSSRILREIAGHKHK